MVIYLWYEDDNGVCPAHRTTYHLEGRHVPLGERLHTLYLVIIKSLIIIIKKHMGLNPKHVTVNANKNQKSEM